MSACDSKKSVAASPQASSASKAQAAQVLTAAVQANSRAELVQTTNTQQSHNNYTDTMSVLDRVPSFEINRSPSEWEKAFTAEQEVIMGGQEHFKRVESFPVDRTPSEWERAFLAEQQAAMGESKPPAGKEAVDRTLSEWERAFEQDRAAALAEAPSRADSFSKLSPEELEKQFMVQMVEAMGDGATHTSSRSSSHSVGREANQKSQESCPRRHGSLGAPSRNPSWGSNASTVCTCQCTVSMFSLPNAPQHAFDNMRKATACVLSDLNVYLVSIKVGFDANSGDGAA